MSASPHQASAEAPRRERLKVGLLVDSLTQPRWVHDIVRDIQQSDFATVALVVDHGVTDPGHRSAGVSGLLREPGRLAYSLYTRIDERLFRREPDAFTEASIAGLLEGVPTLRVSPIADRADQYTHDFPPADVDAIRAHGLDVAISLGAREPRGEALRIARHGVWAYHHGDNLVNRGRPPGFWEVMLRDPVTGSVLQVLTGDPGRSKVIYRSHAPTDTRSVHRNKDNFYRKSAAFVSRKLRDLAEHGSAALDAEPADGVYDPSSRPLYGEPRNAEVIAYAARLAGRYAADKITDRLFLDQWAIAYRLHPGSDGPDTELHHFKLLLPPRERLWADPFAVTVNGRHYVFVEDLPFSTNKGHISVLELDAAGALRRIAPVLEKPHHLSYPYTFEWRGSHFMIPETGANRSVEVYRAKAFPDEWTLEHVMMEGVYAVDTTLVEVDGTWWMFANIGAEGTVNTDELYVFHGPTPLGPWHPHRRNPVKSDGRCARPAGRLFGSKGDLYRPSQDCSGRYGAAIVLNKVLQLDSTAYREVTVSRIEPRWAPNLLGTHTLNSAPGITVADVLVRRRRFARTAPRLP